uniref:Reverse transcriptase domain-containing protein n=1 Tax=Magallana gigas TaxID=29159 RepID=A0A8W8I6Z4_MAGGI
MYKLHRLGVSGRLWTLIDDCHTGTSCSVVVNYTNSVWFPVSQGVRLGGILSTFLYLVFINDLLQEIQSQCSNTGIYNIVSSNPTLADDISCIALTPVANHNLAGCHGQGESSRSQLYSFRAICYLTGSEFLKYPRRFTKSKDLEWGISSVNGLLLELDYSVPFQSETFCFIVLMLAEDMTFMGYQAYRAKKFSETHLLQL